MRLPTWAALTSASRTMATHRILRHRRARSRRTPRPTSQLPTPGRGSESPAAYAEPASATDQPDQHQWCGSWPLQHQLYRLRLQPRGTLSRRCQRERRTAPEGWQYDPLRPAQTVPPLGNTVVRVAPMHGGANLRTVAITARSTSILPADRDTLSDQATVTTCARIDTITPTHP